jgi:hypothetical protein
MAFNEEAVFAEALEIADPRARAAFLDRACGGNAALRAGVEALLATYDAGGFLEVPAGLPEHQTPSGATEPMAGDDNNPSLDFLTPSENPKSLGRLDHYEVLDVIGQGGMGVVLRAFDEQLHRVVAIKVMAAPLATNATARKRFTREAQAQAAVSHDHVVTIHAVKADGPLPYLVMQYVAGASLQQRLDRDGPLQLHEILRIGMQTASGLAAAHAQGLVHRDIKPANILLENGVERVKLTDFGLARAAADANLTQSGVVTGTPHYMSPEQAEGKAVDQRTDLFSLGSVLYAMCTGRAPFRASGSMAVLKRVCEATPTPIRDSNPEIPDWLAAVIDKLHAKDPAGRYQSASEVAELLGRHLAEVQHPSVAPLPAVDQASGGREPPVEVETAGGSRPPLARRRRWAAAAAVLLLLLGGLSLTEATGVTNLRATVVRVFTPDGTLVVETEDPAVKVTVEGDGGLVITGAGHEVRLRPGSYKVFADKDGKRIPLERDLVSIAKGGREVIKVKVEAPIVQAPAARAPAAAAPVKVEKGAFIVQGGAGGEARKFDTLAEAVEAAGDGDTIEVHGNGPFVSGPIRPGAKALTVRAGPGYVPVIVASRVLAEGDFHLLWTEGRLVLEGLELHLPRDSEYLELVSAVSAPLYLTNCKLVISNAGKRTGTIGVDAYNPARGQLRNCLVVAPGNAVMFRDSPRLQWAVENCLIVSTTGFYLAAHADNSPGTKLRLSRNTLLIYESVAAAAEGGLTDRLLDPAGKPVAPLLIEAEETVFQPYVFNVRISSPKFPDGLPLADQLRVTSKAIQWRERRNVYGPGNVPMLAVMDPYRNFFKNLTEWNKFWGLKDTGSVEGAVLLRGNPLDLMAERPEAVTPDDFRLRPGSAGYRAGPGGRDLGADIDLVGPGAAYEDWKKTPDYRQWLKDTGQVKAEAPSAGPKDFVVLGREGVEVGKFGTLAVAVGRAGSGDTIEIRGNGPYFSDPLDLGRKALTIRAASGFAPVIKGSPALVKANAVLLKTQSSLTLEGLELHHEGLPADQEHPGLIASNSAPLYLANCKLVQKTDRWLIESGDPRRIGLRNCLVVAGGPMLLGGTPGMECTVDNCLVVTRADNWGSIATWGSDADNSPNTKFRLRRNTLVSGVILYFGAPQDALAERLRNKVGKAVVPALMEIEENICVLRRVLDYNTVTPKSPKGLPEEEQRQFLPKLLQWRDRDNLYMREDRPFLLPHTDPPSAPGFLENLADWNKFWELKDTGSKEGAVKLRGNPKDRIATAAETITTDDFRLRPDSAGYRAGPGGRDLGADVDLVGPGAAYERWRKTPEYQQWLKDTGQSK